jgi:SAM-dependent methyltransferase
VSWDGDRYQQRFDSLAASGVQVHGEADFVARWQPATVLDAGCGTGRVARELARRGIDTVGVDRDESMIATARQMAPALTWVLGDLSVVHLHRHFDVVVMAGNVPVFTPEGTHAALVAGCARHLARGGCLIAGFQLDRGYGLDDYDGHCRQAGLSCTGRWATWAGEPLAEGGDYAVSVHQHEPDTGAGVGGVAVVVGERA